MKRSNHRVIGITETHKNKLNQLNKASPNATKVTTVDKFKTDRHNSFQYQFVPQEQWTTTEANMMKLIPTILEMIEMTYLKYRVRISEKIQEGICGTVGVWDPNIQTIVLKRSLFQRPSDDGNTSSSKRFSPSKPRDNSNNNNNSNDEEEPIDPNMLAAFSGNHSFRSTYPFPSGVLQSDIIFYHNYDLRF